MLTSTAELEKIIDDPSLILIDARSYQEYSQGHITNAVNLDLFSFHWIDTSQDGISSFNEQFKKIFSHVGVSGEKKVVFYDKMSGMLAARGVWLLEYFSHDNVSMLDGGSQNGRMKDVNGIQHQLPTKQPIFLQNQIQRFWQVLSMC